MNNSTPSLQTLLAALQQWGGQSSAQGKSPFDLSSDYAKSGDSTGGDTASPAPGGQQPNSAWGKLASLIAPKTTAAMAGKGGAG